MTKRHMILAAAASVICLAALLQWGVMPLASYYNGVEKDISTSRQRLQRVIELRQEYELVRSRSGENKNSGAEAADFSLYSFLDRLAEQQDLKGRIVFMRPQTEQLSGGLTREIVRLRLGGVGMSQLVPYLYHLDHADSPVRVEDMTIRSQQKSGQGLQVDLRVSVLKG
ncbi:MAG: type II secretion system protein M [Desulfohalobiaceae bacterium]|nr:type II secretion system protein M [Desulfohalobiaceae bacterium]